MFVKKIFYLLLAICFLFSGCATAPPRETITTYNIAGTTYFSLISLCEQRQINWEYDTFTRTINLERGSHKINLKVGDTLALIDGRAENLRHPVEIYQGMIVAPMKLKEQVLDELFKERYTVTKASLSIPLIKRVVIDPGHGGHDPGAIGKSGLREKDVNLDIAKRLAKLLKDDGINVILTRSNDSFVSLERRVEITNNAKPDLFISIHANANRVRSVNGLEIYYVSPKANDLKRALLAAKNEDLDFDSSYFSGASQNLKATLWDMIYTHNRGESIRLAGDICKIADRNLDIRIIGVKGANFMVLKGAQMPAILVETGFLSNRNEERLLKNGYYRQQIAEAIEQGIRNFARGGSI